jgi:hypothetical protein
MLMTVQSFNTELLTVLFSKLQTQIYIYIYIDTGVIPDLLIQYPWFQLSTVYCGPKKKMKIWRNKQFISFNMHAEYRPYYGEIHQPKCAQYLTHLPLPPYSHLHTEFAYILLLAFSLFTLVAALWQCLCSQSSYLSINFTVFMFITQISCYIYRSVWSAVLSIRSRSWNILPVDTGAHLYVY